ncbi:type II secretion system protein [Aneurinibacillus sp. Ricciae_BoGa-3]|uniref:competence type IV pilus major pilin ComGC n=1 Tax=Aneurinibacillus sp. Ricciae_BoGa-3 TaxID=3022697 RepID=UPI0023406202|nr:type II secretion system protein [Aneurinibacillus sp. Ricciae_BoGa-3]WCK53351.1 type II secretion system protein [Aneurinibacillus sp. Ricciae_BoGa-3]
MKGMLKHVKREKGFTLIEMLIVIAIIGIFLALALPDYKGTVAKAQDRGCKVNQRLISTALESYYIDNGNQYPDETTALTTLVERHYLQSIPKCPSNGTYTVKKSTDGSTMEVSCSVHN